MEIIGVDRTREAAEAARRVLLELFHLLGEYREHMVVVGGSVPPLLCPGASDPYVGTFDVDLAINHLTMPEEGYRSILELMASRGYQQGPQPFMFFRPVVIGERSYQVEVDLLAGEYEGTGRSHRTQLVQTLQPRKARGCDLSFISPRVMVLAGVLPTGENDRVEVRVAAVVPFLVMKAMALESRIKDKDAYDIYYCLANYPQGLETIIDEFRAHRKNPLVKEALVKIEKKFLSPRHYGPQSVPKAINVTDPGEREIMARNAFERIGLFLKKIKELG